MQLLIWSDRSWPVIMAHPVEARRVRLRELAVDGRLIARDWRAATRWQRQSLSSLHSRSARRRWGAAPPAASVFRMASMRTRPSIRNC